MEEKGKMGPLKQGLANSNNVAPHLSLSLFPYLYLSRWISSCFCCCSERGHWPQSLLSLSFSRLLFHPSVSPQVPLPVLSLQTNISMVSTMCSNISRYYAGGGLFTVLPSLTTTNHHWPSLIITDHHLLLLTIIDHHYNWPVLNITAYCWLSPTITDCYWLWLTKTITDCY